MMATEATTPPGRRNFRPFNLTAGYFFNASWHFPL
jgi:hypothetical protein